MKASADNIIGEWQKMEFAIEWVDDIFDKKRGKSGYQYILILLQYFQKPSVFG